MCVVCGRLVRPITSTGNQWFDVSVSGIPFAIFYLKILMM